MTLTFDSVSAKGSILQYLITLLPLIAYLAIYVVDHDGVMELDDIDRVENIQHKFIMQDWLTEFSLCQVST